jgi:PPOX class probable FMN-dependent enzyme
MSTGTDPHALQSVEAVRAVIGESRPGLADKVLDQLDDFAKDFLSKCPFLVLSTSDAEGRVDASPKGDGPGFVWIEDDRTIVIPDRAGNKLAYGHENVLANPQVGILFLIPGTSETLRINGHAELTTDPELLEKLAARGRPAILAIRVRIDECFFHCAKAFIRSKLWKPDTWLEGYRVSFGEMTAARSGAGPDVAKKIDEAIQANYETTL